MTSDGHLIMAGFILFLIALGSLIILMDKWTR
jgi:hypothetical protein